MKMNKKLTKQTQHILRCFQIASFSLVWNGLLFTGFGLIL